MATNNNFPANTRGSGRAFFELCGAAAQSNHKRALEEGVRTIKAAIKDDGFDLEAALDRVVGFRDVLSRFIRLLFQGPGPKVIGKRVARVMLLQHRPELTHLVNATRAELQALSAPPPQPRQLPAAATPASAAAPTTPRITRPSVPEPVLAEVFPLGPAPGHPETPLATPTASRALSPPTIQPRIVGERVAARGDFLTVYTVPGMVLAFARNPHAAFSVPVDISDGRLFHLRRIVACLRDNGDRWFVEVEWEPSLIPLSGVPHSALIHNPGRRLAVTVDGVVVLGGDAYFAVDGVLEVVSTPRQEYALVKWGNTIEPVSNVSEAAVAAFFDEYNAGV